MSKKKLINHYLAVLEDVGIVVNDEGCLGRDIVDKDGDSTFKPIKVVLDGTKEPRMVHMPMQELLDAEDSCDRVYFHPLSENIALGQSEVLTMLTEMVSIQLGSRYIKGITALLSVASDEEGHAKLTNKLSKLINKGFSGDVSKATYETGWLKGVLHKLMAKAKARHVVKIFHRRNRKVDGKKHSRVTTISFQLLDKDFFGVKLTKVAEKAIEDANTILVSDGTYACGSSASVAPYYQALMECFHEVSSEMDRSLHILRKYIPRYKAFDGEWLGDYPKLRKWYKEDMPVALLGNRGVGGGEVTDEEVAAESAPARVKPSERRVDKKGPTFRPPTGANAPRQVANHHRHVQPQRRAYLREETPTYSEAHAPRRHRGPTPIGNTMGQPSRRPQPLRPRHGGERKARI